MIRCDPKLYKTELCRTYSTIDFCPYGDKCQFAHGVHDLRPVHPSRRNTRAAAAITCFAKPVPDSTASMLQHVAPQPQPQPQPAPVSAEKQRSDEVVPEPLVFRADMSWQWRQSAAEALASQESGGARFGVAQLHSPNDAMLLRGGSGGGGSGGGGSTVAAMPVQVQRLSTRPRDAALPTSLVMRPRAPVPLVLVHDATSTSSTSSTNTSSTAASTFTSTVTAISSGVSAIGASSKLLAASARKSGNTFHLYKTAMCRSLQQTGQCAYDVSCRFAHSVAELRCRPMVNERKATACSVIGGVQKRTWYGVPGLSGLRLDHSDALADDILSLVHSLGPSEPAQQHQQHQHRHKKQHLHVGSRPWSHEISFRSGSISSHLY